MPSLPLRKDITADVRQGMLPYKDSRPAGKWEIVEDSNLPVLNVYANMPVCVLCDRPTSKKNYILPFKKRFSPTKSVGTVL